MLTLAKATPLVNLTHLGAVPVTNTTRTDVYIPKKILNELESTGKEFKVKFDILTLKLLKDIAKNGSRILHLTSDVYNSKELCIEGRDGICS